MGQTASSPTPSALEATSCPINHNPPSGLVQCPIKHDSTTAKAQAAPVTSPAQCPIEHGKINPLNQMPNLAQDRAPNQTLDFPVLRTESSIPRDPSSAKWEYPSPQQFYNALVRKGWETPEEHVETMVSIHNFLNEEAWQEVLKWEKRSMDGGDEDPYLAKFKGQPGNMSPKARFMMLAGWLLPSRFNTEAPFDRHDWVVRRPKTGEEVRYVIDYYSAPPEPDGSPVFSLDVRPALDSFSSLKTRISVATEEVWAAMRENKTSSA